MKPRKISDVVDVVLALVPAEEKKFRELLEDVKMDAAFKAPEMQFLSWKKFGEVLEDALGEDIAALEGWKAEVAKVFFGPTEEDVAASTDVRQ